MDSDLEKRKTISNTDFPKPFNSKLAYDIFKNKYAHQGCETWEALVDTLVEEVCGPSPNGSPEMSKSDRDQLKQYMYRMAFIPGGRYLYYAGRPVKFYNNCFTGDTKVITDNGYKPLDELRYGPRPNPKILSPVDGKYYDANVQLHGNQEVYEITFVSAAKGPKQREWTVKATKDHRWPLKVNWKEEYEETTELKVGDIVPANTKSCGYNALGWLHGFMFVLGNPDGTIDLPERKKRFANRFIDYAVARTGSHYSLDPHIKTNWHDLPPEDATPAYIASFIDGWVNASGEHEDRLISPKREYLEWFVEHAPMAALVPSGAIVETKQEGSRTKFHKPVYYRIRFTKGHSFAGFKVKSIKSLGEQAVYCPYEPNHNRFVLAQGIDTYNCYLLRAEEDTREDWANLSWKAESCLITGGGIGADYSVYRPQGAVIKRTGGIASGPIPKMQMINEIGRRVMQGGARRSAIYASLNWKHQDIPHFLRVKNWHETLIPGTDISLSKVKEHNFDYPAPLDMTNISVNYDTEWLIDYYTKNTLSSVFIENVKQALSTGEPGFSFNFFGKESETLRNACTEVTSSDDSDVCNLGSINLSVIDSPGEMAAVTELAVKFLLWGTMRAELPYEKIYKVREKNRRLGLGLMGIHEWLIQRGYPYEVVPELHKWLSIYKGVSDHVSSTTAQRLGISTPVANRSVAPTGTIGMLASTTTGIEPVFAVAYKRRYLVNGEKWKVQYAVDNGAHSVIQRTGAKPDSIESALDLARDPEKRIKFQADVQDYVDMAISSTINLPSWGSKGNNPDTVEPFAHILAKYASRLRGFTCYPDGSRGGQPLTAVPYDEALSKLGEEFDEHIEQNDPCRDGVCGI